jgi:Zn-dependent protease
MDMILFIPVLLFSVVIHEVAHALVAKWEGDETAYRLGRITLNPIPHLDPVGSILVPLLLFFLPGDFLFGWAKPVPVNPRNFRDYKWGDIRVSLAGIAANLLLAVIFTLALGILLKLRVSGILAGGLVPALQQMAYLGLYLNLILAVFNLIPIPPLDGSHVVFQFLPPKLGLRYREVGRYGLGIIMLLVFVFPGGLNVLLWPVSALMSVAEYLIGLWV